MKPTLPPELPRSSADLRRDAEERLQSNTLPEDMPRSVLENHKLVHELQVHQIELELQNEELRRSQAAVESAAARYTDFYDFSPTGFISLARERTILQINLAAAQLLNQERTRLMGARFDSFLNKVDLPVFDNFMEQVFVSGVKQTCEVTVRRKGLSPCYLKIFATLSANKQECRTVLVDITERKSAEEQLKLAALVYEAIGEAIMVADTNNQIVSVNPRFTAVTGYSAVEAIGQPTSLLKSGQHDSAFYEVIRHDLNTTGRWQGEIQNRRKNGEIYTQWLEISTIYDIHDVALHRVAMYSDITKRKRAEATIWRQANYDPLTNLPNRNLFGDRLEQDIKNRHNDAGKLALMFIDLDNFKEINDTRGHSCGDRLLVEAARRISGCVREGDTVARMGGDEFTVILAELNDSLRIDQIAQLILKEIARPYALDEEHAHVSASIGITLFPDDAKDRETLLKNADQAMYQAKALGRNRYAYFTATMQRSAQKRLQLSNDLRGALAAGQLTVYYQPIIALANMRCVKAEALLRWRHPTRGLVEPGEFIPLAEHIGIINEIGHWVFCQAAIQVKQWLAMDSDCVQVSVNQSPRQFMDEENHEDRIAYLHSINVPEAALNIEITEGLLLEQRRVVMNALLHARAAGMQISLDDFGTGYSAMSYLKKFPIDYLKIDQSFIRDMVTDASDQAVVEAIIAMAHKLDMKVIAEGVETAEQRDLLAAAGCDFGQGYLFARPMPPQEFVAFLEKEHDFA